MSVTVPVVPEPRTAPVAVPTWGAARRQGPRRHQADAWATFRSARTGRRAFAVADGVGDSEGAAFAAALAGDHAVRVASLEGRAEVGVAAAGDVLRATGTSDTGDAALVVALEPGGGTRAWEIAWVGDCRALAGDGRGGALRSLTRDHTVAAAMTAMHLRPAPRLEHVLMTSVRTAKRSEIGVTRAEAPASLLLATDGVYRALAPDALTAALLRHPAPGDAAAAAVDAALAAGGRDNATALVLRP